MQSYSGTQRRPGQEMRQSKQPGAPAMSPGSARRSPPHQKPPIQRADSGSSTIADFLVRRATEVKEKSASPEKTDDEVRRRDTFKRFKEGLADQMVQDQQEGLGGQNLLTVGSGAPKMQGSSALSEHFKSHLRQVQDQEERLFDMKLKTARPADQDLFGIKRRENMIAGVECSGYEPTKVLFGGKGEFPTFCRHCNYPAHFHKVEEEKQQIPENLTTLLTGKNIQSEDLNYNCVFAAFLIKDHQGNNPIQTSIEVARQIKNEGIEILTSQKRFLSIQEAFFLRNRIIAQNERRLAKTLAQDFQKPSFENEIKKKGEIDSLNMGKLAQNSEYMTERITQIKEFHMKKMRQSFGTGMERQNFSSPSQFNRKSNSLDNSRQQSSSSPLPGQAPIFGGNFSPNENINGANKDQNFDPFNSINQRDTQFPSSAAPMPRNRAGTNQMKIQIQRLDSGMSPNKHQSAALAPAKNNSFGIGPLPTIQEEQQSFVEQRLGADQSGVNRASGLKSSLKSRSASMPFSRASSIRLDNFDMHDVFQEVQRRESIMPPKYKQYFKIKHGPKTNDQRSKKFVEEIKEYEKAEFLLHALDSNPLLRELIENELLLVVINSSTSIGLQSSLTTCLKHSPVTSDDAILLYCSDNKVKAMEDSIQFSPELFRVQKSIIVSEPIVTFQEMIKMQLAAEGRYIDSQRSDADSVQSDYVRQKLKQMETQKSLRQDSSGASYQGVGTMMRQGTGRSDNKVGRGTTQIKSIRSMAYGLQTQKSNPFRQNVTLKKTQYQDQKAMSLQKKMTILDKMSLIRSNTGAQGDNSQGGSQLNQSGSRSPRDDRRLTKASRKVTFKGFQDDAFRSQQSGVSERSPRTGRTGENASDQPLEDVSQADWVLRIKDREMKKKDEVALQQKPQTNLVQYNFGVMHDFFAYSATCVQNAREEINMAEPLCPAGIRGGIPKLNFKHLAPHYVNMFAVAKVGVANLILPNTLDVKLSNYEDVDSYFSISDHFFPNTARSQHSVIVLRPSIVKNGLNDLLLQIIKANEFLVLKRQIRMLTKAEVAYLFRAEGIQKRNSKLYYDMMCSGACEIIIVSKISAVFDCNTLFNGANPYGRRRINYIGEDSKKTVTRKNIDSVDAMFEIAPFTCFSEFIDLEDFLLRNSNVEKFRKLGEGQHSLDQKTFDKTAELLYATKVAEIRREVNLLQRNFNLVGYTAKNVEEASRQVCIFAPSLGNIQEVILLLNPMYNAIVEHAIEVLIRASFTILAHEFKEIKDFQAEDLFAAKYGPGDARLILENFSDQPVHCFHLAKIAGDREIRELYRQSDLQFEDMIYFKEWNPPLKPIEIPYLFFFMDKERTFELALRLIYRQQLIQYTGNDFIDGIPNPDIATIIQGCLLVTVGDKLKKLMIDPVGNVKQQSKVDAQSIDRFKPVNTPLHEETNEGKLDGCTLEPQFLLKVSANSAQKSCSVHFIAEADSHGLFEVRFHRLAHLGDRENSDTFPAKQIEVDQAIIEQGYTHVVATEAMLLFQRFASCSYYYNEVNKVAYNVCPAFYKFKIHPFQWLFDQLGSQDPDQSESSLITDMMFESTVLDERISDLSDDRTPKVHPGDTLHSKTFATRRQGTTHYLDDVEKNARVQALRDARKQEKEWRATQTARRIMRVYEVEEHMGSEFMEELSRLHQEHLNILRHNFLATINLSTVEPGQAIATERQKSLPAYIYGIKLAEMVKSLEKIKCMSRGQLKGAGKIVYNRQTQVLKGELPRVTQNSYFEYDRKRYLGMLENFKKGWLYYLSVLETDIIESKLMVILNSLTFKYTRQPQFLTVLPDRMTSMNLRISEKIKILNENAEKDKTTKFFKPLSEDLIDPNRELDVRNHVDSVLQTLNHNMLKTEVDKKLRQEGTSIQAILDQQADENLKKKYSIHKDCAIAGIDAIARRPKHHLIASVLWLLDFTLRKVNRKSEFFIGDRNRKIDSVRASVEEEYDEVLDILKLAIETNYGENGNEVNAALDIIDLKQGGYETEFERHMRQKNQAEERKLQEIKEQAEAAKRKARTTMSLDELIEQEVRKPAKEFMKKERQELEKFLSLNAGLDKDGTEFMNMLDKSKMHFGPYAIQLAEEHFNKQMKKFEIKLDPRKKEEQEKISFVKMEYFLYGCSEANRLIEQLKSMENRINQLAQDADNKEQEADALKLGVQRYNQMQVGADRESRLAERRLRKSYQKALDAAKKAEDELIAQRYEISAKETELLLIFRELMAYDYYAPDYMFDREALLRQRENKEATEQYIVPLHTFWRPLELANTDVDYYETDLTDRKFFKKVNPMENVEAGIGQYLPKPLRESILRNNREKIDKLREGGEQTALRPYVPTERTDKIVFEKYMSHGQRRQDAAMHEEKKVIDQKTSKKAFEPDVPFNFTDEPSR